MKSYEKQDCVAIRVQFLAKTDKAPIEMRFNEPMSRGQAVDVADAIKRDPMVFMVTCYTDKGMIF